jgi:uncharacterized membrane protein
MADKKMPAEKTHWLDDKKNVDKIWYALIGLCAISVIGDFFYHKHVKYTVEDLIPGMYGWFGLASCIALVLCAKILRVIVKRREDYYDEADDG